MPRIKPFYAFRPVMHLQERVVTRPLENYSLGQARLMVSENPYSFLHLINPELDNQYLRGSRQELIYKKINENLDSFLDDGVIFQEEKPSIYIYEVWHNGISQTGVWTLTNIDDYLDGSIKKHEVTVERREKLLSEYLQQTGIDANPVLITYHSNQIVEQIIARYKAKKAAVDFTYADATKHRLWAISEPEDVSTLVQAFGDIKSVYIADGHHRIASMAKMAIQKRRLISGDENLAFNYFSTAYFNTDQVKILSFNRLVKDLASLSVEQFFKEISGHFLIEKKKSSVNPIKMHQFGMYLDKSWYQLTAKSHVYDESNAVSVLDVSILQDYVLNPILRIEDPRTDARITFEGGKTTIEELQQQVDNGNYAIAFTLYATSVEQIIAVADVNGVMPPKSTWVEPKFLVGLLTNRF